MKENKLTGIILSGGRSSRMGKEKGLLHYKGKPLISFAISALEPLVDKIIIGANNELDKYQKFGFEIVEDEVKNIGPLGGILSALNHSKTEHNLVLSCDTPYISTNFLSYLYSNINDYEVVVASHGNNKIEPLCGFYSRQIINRAKDNVAVGDYKLRNLFRNVNFQSLTIDDSLSFYTEKLFFNVNNPQDLNQ